MLGSAAIATNGTQVFNMNLYKLIVHYILR